MKQIIVQKQTNHEMQQGASTARGVHGMEMRSQNARATERRGTGGRQEAFEREADLGKTEE